MVSIVVDTALDDPVVDALSRHVIGKDGGKQMMSEKVPVARPFPPLWPLAYSLGPGWQLSFNDHVACQVKALMCVQDQLHQSGCVVCVGGASEYDSALPRYVALVGVYLEHLISEGDRLHHDD